MHQKITYELLKFSAQEANSKSFYSENLEKKITPKFYSVHELAFENSNFKGRKVYWDGKPIQEPDLIKFLSFIEYCWECFRKCNEISFGDFSPA